MAIVLTVLMTIMTSFSSVTPECLTVHVEHDQYGPQVVAVDGWPELSFPGRLNDSIWFQWSNDEPIEVNVSDESIDQVVGCTDGSVSIVYDRVVQPDSDRSFNDDHIQRLLKFVF